MCEQCVLHDLDRAVVLAVVLVALSLDLLCMHSIDVSYTYIAQGLNTCMHIEFKLPKSAGGVNVFYPCCTLNRELERWCSLYGYSYTVHRTEHCVEVRFVDERAYTVFLLGAPAYFTVRWCYTEDD